MQLPLSILVVDDEIDLGLILKQFLYRLGFNVVYFTNPSLAFEHLKNSNNDYALIITDLRMPGMSGIDLANRIREEKILTPKIFLITAFDISDVKGLPDYQTANIERLIQKPFELLSLRKTISQVF